MIALKSRSRAFLALALLLIPGSALGGMGPLEPGTDRFGEDFGADAFRVVSAEDCRDACGQIDECKAMTFVKFEGETGGGCWLKRTIPPQAPRAGMTSAAKVKSWKGEGGD